MNGKTNAKNGAGAIRNGCAVLEVRAPAYSQITVVRADGLIKKQDKGYVDLSDNNYQFYYIIIQKFELSNLEWTVTATRGEETESTTVLITSNKKYEVKLVFKIYLFKAGDQCTSITGGWTSSGWSTSGASTYSGKMQDGKMIIGGDADVSRVLATNQSVSFGSKTLLTVEANTLRTYESNPAGVVELYDSKGSLTATRRFAGASVPGTHGSHTVTIDLSSLSRTGGFVAVRNGGAVAAYKYEVFNIYLS